MEKIRYRLVYNRKNHLNNQGMALVQVEASLNKRKVYMSTNLYLSPHHWDRRTAQVCNHPQADDLNAMLFEFILRLQAVELSLWKQGIPATLALLKSSAAKDEAKAISFIGFARDFIVSSDRKSSTKCNILATIAIIQKFRPDLGFGDIDYAFLKDFEQHLRTRGNSVNTIAKHLRQLRTLVNEAINHGYMNAAAYPFRKYRIKQEKGRHKSLTPDELKSLEHMDVKNKRLRHVLDAFLFCCYTVLRYSDFVTLKPCNIIDRKWLVFKSVKTNVETRLPLHLMFAGKALELLNRYGISDLPRVGTNSEVNKHLSRLAPMAKIREHITFHAARHTCATLLLDQGASITCVQKVLGHTSVKTTEIYAEVLQRTLERELKQLAGRVRKIDKGAVSG